MSRDQLIFVALLFCFLSFSEVRGEDLFLETPVKPDDSIKKMSWTETALLPSETNAECLKKTENIPIKLHVAVNDIYCKKSACPCVHEVAARDYDEFVEILAKEYDIKLEIEYFTEPYKLEEKIAARKFDAMICKPWLAFMLVPKYKISLARIADLLDPSNNQFLTAIFIVPKKSPIENLNGIAGKRIVIGEPDSYEKYFSALDMLIQNSIKPDKIYQKASCLETIGELLDDKADVAVVSDYALTADCAVDIASKDDFKIIANTEKIPLTSFIVDLDKVSHSTALRIQDALIAISKNKLPASMLGKGFVLPAKWTPKPVHN